MVDIVLDNSNTRIQLNEQIEHHGVPIQARCYSAFRQQIQNDNVAEVTLAGNMVECRLKVPAESEVVPGSA